MTGWYSRYWVAGQHRLLLQKSDHALAVVAAQLEEWSLPTQEIRGSNPVIGKLLNRTFVYCQLYWIDENNEKRPGMAGKCLTFGQLLEEIFFKMSIQYTVPGFEPTTFRTWALPITTRPGLPPRKKICYLQLLKIAQSGHTGCDQWVPGCMYESVGQIWEKQACGHSVLLLIRSYQTVNKWCWTVSNINLKMIPIHQLNVNNYFVKPR